MLVTLDIKEKAIDKFMELLKRFPDDDIVIKNQSFINEKERLHLALSSIDNETAKMVSDDDLWGSTEQAIKSAS